MAEKTVNSRIQVKRDSSTNWGKATNFRPKEGEIIFYSDLNQIKIGKKGTDGNDMLLKDLPFLQVTAEEIGDHNHDTQYYSIDTLDAKFEALDTTLEPIVSSYGTGCTASGEYSHAEGHETLAEGDISHAEGEKTTASDACSHAEGYKTVAYGACSHAEGDRTTARGRVSHAEGVNTIAFGEASHAEGSNLADDGSELDELTMIIPIDEEGNEIDITVSGSKAHGTSSHAEGVQTLAYGHGSHAEGNRTRAVGTGSHTEGDFTTASGDYSHAEGAWTTASGYSSHANGYYTRAGYNCQTVVGMCNDNKSNTLFEVGNGTSEDDRRNAFEVLKDGRVKVYGTPTEDEDVVRKKDLATLSSSYTAGNGISIAEDGTISVTFANYTGAFTGDGEII